MCFSATASFTAAAILTTVGFVTTTRIATNRSQKMYAAIPLLFGMQQLAEGIVWTSMGQDSPMFLFAQSIGAFAFLGFALVVWPSWVPWAIFNIETEPNRRLALKIMGFVGFGVSATTMWFLYRSQPTPHVIGQCMAYSLTGITRNVPPNADFLLYMATVPVPFFVSSHRDVKMTGALIMTGLFISHIVNREASTSVWCFFAALSSFYIVWSFMVHRESNSAYLKISN